MYTVYILKSFYENWFYVGLSNNFERRLKQHNEGKSQSTSSHKPFLVVYRKSFTNRVEARDFEKYLKIRSNKEKLLIEMGYL